MTAVRDRVFLAALAIGCCTPLVMWVLDAAGVTFAASTLPPWQLIILYPVLEELAFRGFVQTALLRSDTLARSWLGLTGANAVTAVLFGAAHAWYQPLWFAALVVIPGLVFGLVRDRTGQVWSAIVLHICFNLAFWIGLLWLD